MKKTILWLLILSIISSYFTTAAFAETEDVYEPYVRSINFLNGIGVADIDIQNCDSELTRGEVAKYVYGLLNNSTKSEKIIGVFTDVGEETQYANIIEDLAKKGIIHGYSDGSYQPDKPATFFDAVCILTYVMGLQYEAEINGEDEAAYMRAAQNNGLLDKIKEQSGFVSVGDMAVMMYNALHGYIMEMTLSDGTRQYGKSDKTLLYNNFNIAYDEGIIIKNDITALWAATDIQKGMIEISTSRGNIEVEAGNSDVWQDIGKKVRIYYYCDDEFTYAYHEIHKMNSELTIDLDRIDTKATDLTAGKVSYTDEDTNKIKTKKTDSDFSFLYNNMYYAEGSFDLNELTGCAGSLTLIDNDGDNQYDVISLKKYDTLFVDAISETDNLIFDKIDKSYFVSTDENDYKKAIIKDSNGNDAQFSDIIAGSVISVAQSSASTKEKVIEIIISLNFITGKITKIQSGDYSEVTIDDMKNYFVLKNISTEGLLGMTVTAYLDAFGNIAYFNSLSGRDWQYGICIKKKYDSDNEILTLKIISTDGKVSDYQVGKNIRVDEKTYKNIADANDILNTVPPLSVNVETRNAFVMRYKSNENEEINAIDTLNEGAEKTENYLSLIGNGTFVNCSGSVLGWKIPFESDARVISISARDYSDANNFQESNSVSVGTAASLIRNTGTIYSVAAFKSNVESLKADFIVLYKSNKFEYGTPFFVINKIQEGYNEDLDEVMIYVNGYLLGAEKEYWIDNSDREKFVSSNYKRGDVLRCITDANNRILSWENISKYSDDMSEYTTKNVEGGGLSVSGGSSVTIQDGFVYKKDDSLLVLNNLPFGRNDANSGEIDWEKEPLYYVNIPQSATVTVVDFLENKHIVRSGDSGDIKDYIHQGNNCSRVLMRWRSNSLVEIVVFNR